MRGTGVRRPLPLHVMDSSAGHPLLGAYNALVCIRNPPEVRWYV
jgi:hypothetical protein